MGCFFSKEDTKEPYIYIPERETKINKDMKLKQFKDYISPEFERSTYRKL